MKKYSIPAFTGLFQIAIVAALLSLNPKAVLRADIHIDSDSTPAVVTNTASAASTNAAPKTTTSSATITIKDDDDDDDTVDGKGAKHIENIQIGGHHGDHGDGGFTGVMSDLEDDLVPILGILATFGTPILIVFFVCYFNYRRRQANLDLAREYLSKGMPVPAELLDSSQSSRSVGSVRGTSGDCSDMRKGFKLTFIGLGVSLALYVFSSHGNMWGWGLIPMVMGLGYLASSWVESRRTGKLPETSTPPPPDKPA